MLLPDPARSRRGIIYYFGLTQGWTKEYSIGFFRPDPGSWTPLPPDPDSVMMYPFPAECFREGSNSRWYRQTARTSLSDYDRRLIRMIYPRTGDEGDNGERRLVEDARSAISQPRAARAATDQETKLAQYDVKEHWSVLKAKSQSGGLQGAGDASVKMTGSTTPDRVNRYVCRLKARNNFVPPDPQSDVRLRPGIRHRSPRGVLSDPHLEPCRAEQEGARACQAVFPIHGGRARATTSTTPRSSAPRPWTPSTSHS